MKRLKELVDMIDDELCGAKEYAEKYVELKAFGDSAWASRFKAMASDELAHATNIHEYAVQEIESLNKVYTAPVEMQDKWDKSHAKYVEKTAWVKQMLAM